jgi:hypothetical protein
MSVAQQLHEAAPNPAPMVVPVRYVARGEIVQTTSAAVTRSAMLVRSFSSPATGLRIGLKLYLPDGKEEFMPAVVAQVERVGFWAEPADGDPAGAGLLAALAAAASAGTPTRSRRFQTHARATLRTTDRPPVAAWVSNLSRSGAFVRVIGALPELGSQVDLQIELLGAFERVGALVVHTAAGCGLGVQFIGGGDSFRARLDTALAQLAGAEGTSRG